MLQRCTVLSVSYTVFSEFVNSLSHASIIVLLPAESHSARVTHAETSQRVGLAQEQFGQVPRSGQLARRSGTLATILKYPYQKLFRQRNTAGVGKPVPPGAAANDLEWL